MGYLKFSPTIGKPPKILKVIPESIKFALGLSFFLPFGLYWAWENIAMKVWGVGSLNAIAYLIAFALPLFIDLFVRGDPPYKFDTQFWRGKDFVRAGVSHDPTKTLLPKALPNSKINGKRVLPIENEFDLIAYIDFQFGTHPIGGYLIKDGLAGYILVFAWQLQPFPSSLSGSDALSKIKRIRKALGSIPEDEILTFRVGSWRVVPPLPKKARNKMCSILDWWERDRVAVQSIRGRRTEKTIHAYASFRVAERGKKAADPWEKFFDFVKGIGTANTQNLNAPPRLAQLLKEAYTKGFQSSDRLLTGQFGINSIPLTAEEIWEIDYRRFNDGPVPQIPFKIVVDGFGYRIEKGSGKHIISGLFALGSPKQKSKRAVFLPGKKKVVRGCVLDSKPLLGYESELPEDALAQLFWGSSFWNDSEGPALRNMTPENWDSEYVVQFTGQSQWRIRKEAERLENEANYNRQIDSSKDQLSSSTDYKMRATMTANTQIMDGAKGIRVGWVGLTYRDTIEEADDAINRMAQQGNAAGYVVTENEYFPKIWRQTLPFSADRMLGAPVMWDRRIEDLTGICASFVPIVSDASISQEGFEYQSEYGNSPYFVPSFPFNTPQRTLTLGFPGSGKSLKAGRKIVAAYKEEIPTVVIDATQGDVATFKPICDALNGTFFNSRERDFNLLQAADMRRLIGDKEKMEFAESLIRDQWKSTLSAIALGGRTSGDLKAGYEEVSAMLIRAWWEDPDILRRYDLAYDSGFGGRDWAAMPTLLDYIELATINRLPTHAQTDENRAILEQYKSRLAAFTSTEIGRRLSSSSDIDVTSKLVVAAIGGVHSVSDNDILPLISSVMALATSAALTNERVLIEGDEASELSRFDCYSIAFGSYFSGGRKQGISCGLIGQELESIQAGAGASRITKNPDTIYIGKITPDAADCLALPASAGGLGAPRELLARLIPEERLTKKGALDEMREEAFSRWAIRHGQTWTLCRFAPSFFQLAISVNGQREIAERNKILALYPDDRIKGYVEFGKLLKSRTNDYGVVYK